MGFARRFYTSHNEKETLKKSLRSLPLPFFSFFANLKKGTIMYGRKVSPLVVQEGDKIATKTKDVYEYDRKLKQHVERTIVLKSVPVTSVDISRCRPECAHINGVCYDSRFDKAVLVG